MYVSRACNLKALAVEALVTPRGGFTLPLPHMLKRIKAEGISAILIALDYASLNSLLVDVP